MLLVCIRVSSNSVMATTACVSLVEASIRELCSFAASYCAVDPKIVDYLQCLFSEHRCPNLRLLLKVHKDPIAARDISSGSRWASNPAAACVAEHLCTEDTEIHTFDVAQLYPKME